MTDTSFPIPNVIGILGGGQLGRMSALAAARLGIKTHIYCPEGDCPAAQISTFHTQAAYEDEDELDAFAASVEVITYEFENIPVKTVQYLDKLKPVYPRDNLLDISQNRLKEKQFLNDISIPTAAWGGAKSVEEVRKIAENLDLNEFILKTTRFGYDGKGQILHRVNDNLTEQFLNLKTDEVIVEGVVDFLCEISVVVARNAAGDVRPFPPVLNEHKNHILDKTIFPAPIDDAIKVKATDLAVQLAEAVSLIGVLTIELFVTRDGALLANEIAPRTHNSGHWSIDACAYSQFDQHIRAICGLPLHDPAPHHAATMINLIGDDVQHTAQYNEIDKAHLHLYGKADIKPGRKMGHVTILGTSYHGSTQND